MNKKDIAAAPRDVGLRFVLFRKAIRKTLKELTSELGAGVRDIPDIEAGKIEPKIEFLHYLNGHYGLNINWMLCGDGDMFAGPGQRPPDVNGDFAMKPEVKEGEPGYTAYREFFRLMRIPAVQKAVWEGFRRWQEELRREE